jgi:hypothetical protein
MQTIVDQIFDTAKQAKILTKALPTRVIFNPRNKKHRESVKTFLETGKWGDVLFVPEAPHIEVPATVLSKLAAHTLGMK